jgi:L-2-hydroxycarboxylate dehydrogenase (NAD+)
MAAQQQCIGIYGAVGNGNVMAPWGGVSPLLSTNPIAVAIPSIGGPDVVLDMATTAVSSGRLGVALSRGEPLPDGWLMDTAGKPIIDPSRAQHALFNPAGGAKGYGLALVVGILAGTLNGAAFGNDVVDIRHDPSTATNTGQFFCALHIESLAEPELFDLALEAVRVDIHASEVLPGAGTVRLPGERSAEIASDRKSRGIPVPQVLVERLNADARTLGTVPLSA